MRDGSGRWSAPFDSSETLSAGGVAISTFRPGRLCLVSGVDALRQTGLPLVGWPAPAPSGGYALVLRRDRVLEVDGPPREDGWDGAAGLAVSNVTDGYHAFLIEGQGAFELLKTGAELSLDRPSASAARPLWGLPAILYRLGAETRFAALVPGPHAAAAWLTFRSVLPAAAVE